VRRNCDDGQDASIFEVGDLNVAVLGDMVWFSPRFFVATAEFSGGLESPWWTNDGMHR
jgi:hypothetical protein